MNDDSVSNNEQATKDEKRRRIYQYLLHYFRRFGLELAPAEAVYLRSLIVEVVDANEGLDFHYDKVSMEPEAEVRFFWNYFGIKIDDWIGDTKGSEEIKKRYKEIFQYIKERVRPEMEGEEHIEEIEGGKYKRKLR
ncbi:hypothetical protein EXS71_01970 [Candidatus Uhrbacteria bacterium]|nr:hypothetical protein [Candidatus Uhrbacteria bacterium]